jgi:hypothetical protein
VDLGLEGKSAMVCAASKDLGRGCAGVQAAYLTDQNLLLDGGAYPGTF